MVLQNRKFKVSLEYRGVTKGDVKDYDFVIMRSIPLYVADGESCIICSNSIDILIFIENELINSCRIVKGKEDGKPYLLLYNSNQDKLMEELEGKSLIKKLDIF